MDLLLKQNKRKQYYGGRNTAWMMIFRKVFDIQKKVNTIVCRNASSKNMKIKRET